MIDRANGDRMERDIEPISQAVHQLAMSFHEDIVRDLGQSAGDLPVGFEDRLALHQRTYPHLLFGELAMHLAGVELPPNATAPDRARGIIEALRRISETPSLFEAVTNAPYTKELANGLAVHALKAPERNDVEIAEAVELQKKVATAGYLDRSMVPDKRVVQLKYAETAVPKQRRRDRRNPKEPAVITLKIVPADHVGWVIKQYKRWNDYSGYSGYIGERKVQEHGVFTLIAVNSTGEVPSRLEKLIGDAIKIGKISTGTQLNLTHNFRRPTEEVPGYEGRLIKSTLSYPAMLKQAYLGDLTDYPLFS